MNTGFKEKPLSERTCIIWLHGLGADASDMQSLSFAPPIAALDLHHVFLNAPIRPVTLNAGMRMRAWYDVVGFDLSDREDKEGILASKALVLEAIEAELKAGFLPEHIVLAGFSQGGAMALYTALHTPLPLAGVIALSSYLPLSQACAKTLSKDVPIFLALGQSDTIVLPKWTEYTADWLKSAGYSDVTLQSYPMEHSICPPEIQDLSLWLSSRGIGAAP